MLTFSQAFKVVTSRVKNVLNGRTSRSEYLWTVPVFFIINVILMYIIDFVKIFFMFVPFISSIVNGILYPFAVCCYIVFIALTVRRLHDRNMSGWLIFLDLIPFIGPLIVFILCCFKGTDGPNRFGPDPLKDPNAYADVGQPNYNILNEQENQARAEAFAQQQAANEQAAKEQAAKEQASQNQEGEQVQSNSQNKDA